MIKPIDAELYEIFCGWWRKKNCAFGIPKEVLPEGYVSFVNDKPVFAGFLYHQGPWGWLGFITVNPDADSKERETGMKGLIDHIDEISKGKGIKFLFTPTNNGSLIARLESNGFKRHDVDVVHLLKLL